MFYGTTVEETRALFFHSWHKFREHKPLSPLEKQIADVILIHPEYHAFIEGPSQGTPDFHPELGHTNPFLHLGLHLALREQVHTNRPAGITSIYESLLTKHQDVLLVEHLMMESLAECLWLAQKNNLPPDENHYIMLLKEL